MIEFTLLEQDAEVLQDGGKTTRGCRRLLERLDDLVGSENALQTLMNMMIGRRAP